MALTDIENIEMPRMPMLAGGRVVAVGHAGRVHVIDMETARTLWTHTISAEPGASACEGQPVTVAIADEMVIAGSMGHVFALALDDGSVLWHTNLSVRGSGDTSLAFGSLGTGGGDYVTRLES